MSSGTLIEAPPVERAAINEYVAVDRGGKEWTGWVRALNGEDSALVQWDNGIQGVLLWTEPWRKLAPPAPQGTPAPAPLYPTCDNSAAVTVSLCQIQPFELNPREFKKLPGGSIDPDQHGLRALAESLVAHGQQQPIIVRPLGDGRFGLVDGERRYWAAHLAGLAEVRVEVRALDDLQALVSTIAASSHAEAYPIADQARAVQFLRARDRSQEEIAKLLGTNQQTVSTLSRFARLPGEVQQLVRDGQLQLGHVRQLVRDHLVRVPKAVIWIAQRAVETRASVRHLEYEIPFEVEMPRELLRQLRAQPAMELPPNPEPHPLTGKRFEWIDPESFRGRVGTLTGVDDGGLATLEADDQYQPQHVFMPVSDLAEKGFRQVDPAAAAHQREIDRLRDEGIALAHRNGHRIQSWDAHPAEQTLDNACYRCGGKIAVLTSAPPRLAPSPRISERCEFAPAPPAATPPAPVPEPALVEYAETLQGLSTEALFRQYGVQHRANEPFLFDLVEREIETRIASGEAISRCAAHGMYEPCPQCAAAPAPGPAERIDQLTTAAGVPDLAEPLKAQAGLPAWQDAPAGYDAGEGIAWRSGREAAQGSRPFAPPQNRFTEAWVAGWESVKEAPELWPEAGELLASAQRTGEVASQYSAMSADAIVAEMEAHEAAGIELPADQHNARIDALEAAVLAEDPAEARPTVTSPEPAVDPRKQPVKTAAEIAEARAAAAAPVKPKPGALKTAEEKVAEQRSAAPPAAAPKPPPVTAVIPAVMADRLAELGGGIVPAIRTWCKLAEIAEEHEIEVPTAVELVQRFLGCCGRMGTLPDAVLAAWEKELPQGDASELAEATDGE